MKYDRKEINKYLIHYQLKGEENKFDRLTLYNDILFHNISFLTNTKETKSIIIINEKKTGGVIFCNPRFIDKVFDNLKKKNRNLAFNETRRVLNINKRVTKLSFACKDKYAK